MLTGEIEKMMYYILGNTMGSLQTHTYFRSSCLERSDDLKYVCVRLHNVDQIAILYFILTKRAKRRVKISQTRKDEVTA